MAKIAPEGVLVNGRLRAILLLAFALLLLDTARTRVAADPPPSDIITAIGDHRVANLYDMSNALNARQPGDTVAVTVRRGTEELTFKAVLGRRGS